MRFVDEFRDPEIIARTCDEIRRLADPGRHYRFMEVCGGHTHAIYRFGLKDVLPSNVELIHGPGCPVCVLPMGRIDDGLTLAKEPNVIFAAFGDMMRVPGAHGSPLEHKARGLDVRIVYSPTDALKLARRNPDKHVLFFAIGFETTAPSTALTLMRAKAEGIRNFSVFCNHVTIIPAIRAILSSPDMRLDAFIGPGHVSTVIGCRPYEWIARDERKPIVVSGFEPLDILQSIVMLLRQLRDGTAIVENQYKRVVPWEGNKGALRAMAEVFQLRPFFEWRGLGFISQSALAIRAPYSAWDAETVFRVAGVRVTDPKAAQCGEVLKGVLKPVQCKLFGRECTPERPVGALMVSSEGSCAAYYNYEHRKATPVPSTNREPAPV
ncbi:MAG TPA: hydrogenase formation protein HypD [Gemmatimonadaceae bacterium]|jgi:hydrogenase expression/formation protein HypD|nr:hydrogenase formation protein HypD [Gemmatimonadaceae bacterium]